MFELTIVPLYFLIGQWGHGRRVYAATKFFLFTMFGLGVHARVDRGPGRARPAPATAAASSFDLLKIVASDSRVARTPAGGCSSASPSPSRSRRRSFPFHTWLPDAHTEAPTAGSIDLAGVLLKLGTYGFLRYGLYLFPEASVCFAPVLLTLAIIGIIYGAIVAAMQKQPEAAGRLLVGVAHGLRHPRPVRPHHPGPRGQRPA